MPGTKFTALIVQQEFYLPRPSMVMPFGQISLHGHELYPMNTYVMDTRWPWILWSGYDVEISHGNFRLDARNKLADLLWSDDLVQLQCVFTSIAHKLADITGI